MSHANAAQPPRTRLTVAHLVVDQDVSVSQVAAQFQYSWPTVKSWTERHRTGESMHDRSSRPTKPPTKTPL